jgi:oxygen-independent coproporphyrinogen-3 oxidase
MAMNHYSLYFHIPFCDSRCSYCDYVTHVGQEALIPRYVEALCSEIKHLAETAPGAVSIKTLYFGGGTPSLLPVSAYKEIFTALETHLLLLGTPEITLEANPGDLNQEYLAGLFSIGINRLSLGMQTALEPELELLGRRHSSQDVEYAVRAARSVGFININLDLIFNLPGQSLSSWQTALEHALALEPTHLSTYELSLEPGTPLYRQVKNGTLPGPDPDTGADMMEFTRERLEKADFRQYEISNWTRVFPREKNHDRNSLYFVCQHNLSYWRNEPYLGLGAGSHGFAEGFRTINVSALNAYLKRMSGNGRGRDAFPWTPAVIRMMRVDSRMEMQDTMMMGLRLTEEGVSEERFRSRFGVDITQVYGDEIRDLLELDLLVRERGILRLSDRGRMLGNQVFMRFVD